MTVKIGKVKNLNNIVDEWDAVAAIREEQISSGKDNSANCVLAPAILNSLKYVDSIIDIGCGTGWLTERASVFAVETVGVDPSSESIEMAKARHSAPRISYFAESIEEHSKSTEKYDLGISNMVASSAPDLSEYFVSTRRVLKEGALFIFSIPHPCFWSIYWGYGSDPDFNYMETLAVESKFRIQEEIVEFPTTHFHRPVYRYISELLASNFKIESVDELMGKGFDLPRFMLINARAV
ncbi:class I SAM-dependent methyltransferase [Granulosicoccus antarcticus]|uniref:Ubiquinone biosynthesis O-methyltransferase n=1 Tax=Granulosicoccus antarcticus IMCC3135 TaxID=1192854 RepID=A0A2Z2NXM4_9GAMM|nr:class I SAM-dependent methyltransferase [Granulosicoccus antarcticus]ASJ76206.1 Ubiquinone biosynthesis O-methyltransferase [Granulosicoccus antarcticus IMCC3135]